MLAKRDVLCEQAADVSTYNAVWPGYGPQAQIFLDGLEELHAIREDAEDSDDVTPADVGRDGDPGTTARVPLSAQVARVGRCQPAAEAGHPDAELCMTSPALVESKLALIDDMLSRLLAALEQKEEGADPVSGDVIKAAADNAELARVALANTRQHADALADQHGTTPH